MRARLSSHSGREVIFGMRPEHIHSRSEVRDPTPGQIANAKVSVVEPLGSEVFAYLSADGHEFIARFDVAAQPRPGDTIETVFETDRLHIFDKETEQALT
jgi:multiple sugar transport system ATP-binding protein